MQTIQTPENGLKIKRNKWINIRWRRRVLVLVVTVILLYFLGPWRQDVTALSFRRVQFEEIVTAIQTGTLLPDARGIVVLPAKWADLTKDGKVYVTRDSHGIRFILLPAFQAGVWFSSNSNFAGYVYSTRPLTGLSTGSDEGDVTLTGPVLASPQYTAYGVWTSGQTDAYISKKIDAHWYEVYTDND